VAIFLYLADLFPQADSPRLRRSAARPSALDGLLRRAFEPRRRPCDEREAGTAAMSPYGDYDTMLKTLTDQLAKGPTCWASGFPPPIFCGHGADLDDDVQAGAESPVVAPISLA